MNDLVIDWKWFDCQLSNLSEWVMRCAIPQLQYSLALRDSEQRTTVRYGIWALSWIALLRRIIADHMWKNPSRIIWLTLHWIPSAHQIPIPANYRFSADMSITIKFELQTRMPRDLLLIFVHSTAQQRFGHSNSKWKCEYDFSPGYRASEKVFCNSLHHPLLQFARDKS